MRVLFLVCLMILGLTVPGCAQKRDVVVVAYPNLPQAMPVDPPGGSTMLTANTCAGDALHKMLLVRMNSGTGILTTSLVNMDDFEESSPFGRMASQQIGSRIGQYGFRIIEARLGADLRLEKRQGEFMLTRDACRLLADAYDADAVLVGTYSDAGNKVFVSTRVVRLSDNTVMAAYEYYLPRDADVAMLLPGYGRPYGSPVVGGDSVWYSFAAREPAFPYRPGYRSRVADGPSGAGRYIDPNSPPTPMPGRKAKAAPPAPVRRAPEAPVEYKDMPFDG